MVAAGRREDGDADNRLLEITFAESPGATLQERQDALLSRLEPIDDPVTHVEHDPELLGASRRAKAKLALLKPRFQRGLAPGEVLLVKGPFDTASGGTEWMWIEVVRWEGPTVRGVLMNDPQDVPGLAAGAPVTASEDTLFDYLLKSPDGRTEGNETSAILQRRGDGKLEPGGGKRRP